MSASPETLAEDSVSVEIDGVEYPARKGAMIIEVTDANGITVPRFCYHPKLPVAANCRMCMVQVEMGGRMMPKPLPACATPVADGMKVWTKSDYARDAQRAVMEFLLINHPLDCPICDQGGECELQDLALGYGRGVSRFTEDKRVVADKNFGPLIATAMTRCIHCTRCVRFLEHVAGHKELGGTGRGENVEIGTWIEHSIESELSGNVIDVCPVGALTSKPFLYRARAWEMIETPGIGPHDCVGSNLYLHTRRGELLRVAPRDNEAVNEVWLSDRDRFGYEGINSDDRLMQPMVRRDGEWQAVDWEQALQAAVDGLRGRGADLGVLASPSATVEEHALLARLAAGLGTANIDHRLRQADFTGQEDAPLYPALGRSIESLERADAVLVIGGNPRKDQPMLGHRLRKAALAGAAVMHIDMVEPVLTYPLAQRVVVAPDRLVQSLAGVAAALLQAKGARAPEALQPLLDSTLPDAAEQAIAATLTDAGDAVLLLGIGAHMHPAFSALRALAVLVAELSGAGLGFLADGANAAGAHLAGVLPHREAGGRARAASGLDAAAMLRDPRKAWLLLGIEPELDCADGAAALAALQKAEFVVALTPFATAAMRDYADVLLPVSTWAETSGTFVNCEGRWQSFTAAARAPGETRPGWKVLRVLGNLCGLQGFGQDSTEEVRDELRALTGEAAVDNMQCASAFADFAAGEGGQRIGELPLYAVDALVRRAAALQDTPDAQSARAVHLCSADADRLGLGDARYVRVRQGSAMVELPLRIDDCVPEGCARVATGLAETAALGAPFAAIQIEKVPA